LIQPGAAVEDDEERIVGRRSERGRVAAQGGITHGAVNVMAGSALQLAALEEG
jgi:hypothetical protein